MRTSGSRFAALNLAISVQRGSPSSSSLAPAASVGSLPAGISGPPASPRPIAASTSVATPQPAAKKPRLVPKPSPPVLARSTSAVTSVASGAVAAGVLEETDMSQPPQPAVLKSKSSHEPGACAQPPVPSHSAPLIAAAAPHVTAHAAPPSSLPAHADRPRYSTDAAAQVLLGVPDLVLHDCVVDFAPCQQRISPDTLPPLADWMCARQCSTPLSQGIADDVTTAVAHAISKALASPPVTAALSGSSLASSADNSGCSSSSMAAIMVGAPTPHTALLRAMSGMLDGSTGNGAARNVSVRTYDSLPHFMEASAAEMMSTVRTASNEAAAAAGSSPAAAGSCSAASACVLPPMPPSLAMLSRFSTDFVSAPQVAAMVDSVVRRLRSGNVLGISGHLCYDDIVAPSVTASTPTPPAPASVLVFSVPMHLGVPPVDAFLAAAGRVHAQMQVAVGGGKPRPRLQELFNADQDCRALRKALIPYAISLKTACSGARFAPCSSVAVLVASRPRMNAALVALHEPAVLSLARDLWSAALAAALRSLGEPPSARGSVVSITGAKYSLNAISVETVAHSPSTQILLRSAAPPVMEWCGREYVIASIVLSPAAK
ncbi:MAG: hypothetical protein EOO41_01670 [Methanobacteriota archaeon]|nr:MAG: hypothetical protein EOO41_01670 [Euryarchaeota archaeon]